MRAAFQAASTWLRPSFPKTIIVLGTAYLVPMLALRVLFGIDTDSSATWISWIVIAIFGAAVIFGHPKASPTTMMLGMMWHAFKVSVVAWPLMLMLPWFIDGIGFSLAFFLVLWADVTRDTVTGLVAAYRARNVDDITPAMEAAV